MILSNPTTYDREKNTGMSKKKRKNKKQNISDKLVVITEKFLTWRKRRKLIRREKQKRKNPILDWADAIISAVFIVLLINQYLLQAYVIPSQSMIPSLLIGDRIFVNKIIYGPELLPGKYKLPGFREPKRGEIIIFENPTYISKGPAIEIIQRIVYMITLTLVDLDKDEYGRPRHHFLIKRAIGMPGDRLRMRKGFVEIKPPGTIEWLKEKELQKMINLSYPIRRQFQPDEYNYFKEAGIGITLLRHNLNISKETDEALERYFQVTKDSNSMPTFEQIALVDNIYIWKWMYKTEYEINPSDTLAKTKWRFYENGVYIPEDRIFPMGDNRDDSRDARYFGPVLKDKILGKASFRFWPIDRFGKIK